MWLGNEEYNINNVRLTKNLKIQKISAVPLSMVCYLIIII